MHITTAEELLNKKSGFKALTGTSDFGEISQKASEGDAACKLAFELFLDRVLNFVGSYYVKLGGNVDALVFAGGIGEKGVEFRQRVVERVACLGFEIDQDKNKSPANDVVTDIGVSGSKHRVLICQTDEQVSDIPSFSIHRPDIASSLKWHVGVCWRLRSRPSDAPF